MKRKRYQKISVVADTDPQVFETKLNDIFYKLGSDGTKYERSLFNNENGFSCFITYEEVEEIPECLMDEYHLKGIYPICGECPYYTAINKHEGECPHCRGLLRRTDDVKDCTAYWNYVEEQEGMYQTLRTEIKAQYGTLYKFAEATDIDNTYLSSMLNGRYPFSAANQIKILKALGIELSEESMVKYFGGEHEH